MLATRPELVLKEGLGGAKGGLSGAGRGVSSIEKGMKVNALRAAGRRGPGHGKKVSFVAVHPAGREQADQVDRTAFCHGCIDGADQFGIFP